MSVVWSKGLYKHSRRLFFNVVPFGSRYSSLFPQSKSYSEESFNHALAHAAAISADHDGIEIYPVLNNLRNDITRLFFVDG